MSSNSIDYVYCGGVVEVQRGVNIPKELVLAALRSTNRVFQELSDVAPYVFRLLQMRNLSAFVGAAFCHEMAACSDGLLVLNPHQDGYPDLLTMDHFGRQLWTQLDGQYREKEPFSPFAGGGLEVKATCGDVPSARVLTAQGVSKPDIGDSRIELVKGLNWKAHHRETNQLMAIQWDFVDSVPAIVAVMYSKELSESDWGKIVSPVEGGGRTTSVSIMNRDGVKKLASNPIYIIDDSRYVRLISRFAGTANAS